MVTMVYIYIYIPLNGLFCIVITEIYVGVLPLVVAPTDAAALMPERDLSFGIST